MRCSGRRGAGAGGFTLMELLVVISIIGFLMAFVVGVAINLTMSSHRKAAEALLNRVQLALDHYHVEYREYPPVENQKRTANLYRFLVQTMPGFDKPFMEKFNKEDFRITEKEWWFKDPWKFDLIYWAPGESDEQAIRNAVRGNYHLYSVGPDGTPGTPDDVIPGKGK